jgi:hypothetical protein
MPVLQVQHRLALGPNSSSGPPSTLLTHLEARLDSLLCLPSVRPGLRKRNGRTLIETVNDGRPLERGLLEMDRLAVDLEPFGSGSLKVQEPMGMISHGVSVGFVDRVFLSHLRTLLGPT